MSRFLEQLAAAWPAAERRARTIVVAVSGGADSVALMHALAELREADSGRIVVAHFNHNLRGDESTADAAFVVRTSVELGLPCTAYRAAVGDIPVTGADGLEAAAREARYAFLAQIAREHGARFVATGHTWNDQVETILHRLIRGTGLEGLAGIPRFRPLNEWTTVVRPMLEISREAVLSYLGDRAITYRHDESNDDIDLTRNRIRHELLPLLAVNYNPRVADALSRLGRLASETQEFVQTQTDAIYVATVQATIEAAEVNAARLATESPFVIRAVLTRLWREADWPRQEMSLAHWERLADAVRATTPITFDLPGPIRVSAADGILRMEPSRRRTGL